MTRRNNRFLNLSKASRVDSGNVDPLVSIYSSDVDGQGVRRVKINEDVWQEFVLIAQYLYRQDEEAEIADVFEFFRTNVYGGDPYSASTIARADREVATDIANGH